MIIMTTEHKTKNAIEVGKARTNYKVCECEHATDNINVTLRRGAGSEGEVSM